MAVHGFIPSASLDAVVADVIAASKKSGLAFTVELAEFDDGVELRLRDAASMPVRSLVLNLAATHPLVRFAECEIAPGSRGAQVSATGIGVTAGELEELDLTPNAVEVLYAWSAGGPVHEEEIVADGLAAALLERNPDTFRTVKVLRFRPRR